MFKALQVLRDDDKHISTRIAELTLDDLPEGDVTVAVSYSTLNYKDGLVLNGLGGLVKNYPHVPGIDFAGVVEHSEHADFKPGDTVILTGWRVGEIHWGGYAERARVSGDWLVPMPASLDARRAMAIGTAGFSAMLGVMALERQGVTPESGPVLVTGATGGVGSVACALLAKAGYTVHGSTGRADATSYLQQLGVSDVIDRAELAEAPSRPLAKETWAGCIDSVGGTTLANVLTQIRYGGSVAAIGLAGGNALETTVIPFLLRGVNLLGIDSVMLPSAKRPAVWQRLADDLSPDLIDSMVTEISLDDVVEHGARILKGGVRGRSLVRVG